MKRIGKKTTREQLAAAVFESLNAAGVEAVLVGGAVVSIYTHDRFPSDDLDLAAWRPKEVKQVLGSLGFLKVVGNKLFHPTARYYVQIVNAPPIVGNKYVKDVYTHATPAGPIRMLSPLDCVLDRLAHFFVWNDRQCLQQAAHVAVEHEVDLAAVRKWATAEGALEKLEEFLARVGELS